jgi:hypothetical protein
LELLLNLKQHSWVSIEVSDNKNESIWMVNHPNGCRHWLLLTGFKTSDIWKCTAKFLMQSQIVSINASQPRCFSEFVTPLCETTINYFMRSITRSLETVVLKRRLGPALPLVFTLSLKPLNISWVISVDSSYCPLFFPIINFEISISLMSLLLLYPETLGNGCSQFKSYSLLSCLPPIYIIGFDIKVNHQKNSIYMLAHITLSIMSHATLILFYHAFMLTLQNSLVACALWLLQAWYYGV